LGAPKQPRNAPPAAQIVLRRSARSTARGLPRRPRLPVFSTSRNESDLNAPATSLTHIDTKSSKKQTLRRLEDLPGQFARPFHHAFRAHGPFPSSEYTVTDLYDISCGTDGRLGQTASLRRTRTTELHPPTAHRVVRHPGTEPRHWITSAEAQPRISPQQARLLRRGYHRGPDATRFRGKGIPTQATSVMIPPTHARRATSLIATECSTTGPP
jgi:hypothetical protein